MIVTFPQMGTMGIPVKALLKGLGLEVLVPPATTKRTLELGTKYSPEGVCMPFKLGLGNFIESLNQGADTIITSGGIGPCRLGLYSIIQKNILRDLGFKFNMIILEPNFWMLIKESYKILPLLQPQKIYQAIQIAYDKLYAVDYIESQLCEARATALEQHAVDRLYADALIMIDNAACSSEITSICEWTCRQIKRLERHKTVNPLQIGLVGEIYVNLEPFVNQNITLLLGRLGVNVVKTLTLKDYVLTHLFKSRNAVKRYNGVIGNASKYLGYHVGGHAIASVGQYIALSKRNFDGIIHLYPFGCMPEVIVKNIFPQVTQDCRTPLLSLSFDEQTGIAGITTRIEAFVDLLRFNRLHGNFSLDK